MGEEERRRFGHCDVGQDKDGRRGLDGKETAHRLAFRLTRREIFKAMMS